MKKKKKLIILLIICLFLTVIMMFIALYVTTTVEKFDETNTVEHNAMVLNIETDSKKCKIYTEKFNCALTFQLTEIIGDSYLVELHNGVEITFRIPEFYDYLLSDNDIESLDIVSLKTDNMVIVSLESHNNMIEKKYSVIKIIGLVFSALFFIGAIICSVLLIKTKKRY